MLAVTCQVCGVDFVARRASAKYCSERCRTRMRRSTPADAPKRAPAGAAPEVRDPMVSVAVRAEVAALPALVGSCTLAVSVVRLAELFETTTDASLAASLSRELRATLAELRQMAALAPEGTDVVDDLLARRRRGGGFPPQRGAPRD